MTAVLPLDQGSTGSTALGRPAGSRRDCTRRRALEIRERLLGRSDHHALCAERRAARRAGARRLAPRRADGAALGRMKPIIAVIGGGTSTTEQTAVAEETGRLLAQRGAVLVCGGLGGVKQLREARRQTAARRSASYLEMIPRPRTPTSSSRSRRGSVRCGTF